jgi:hypothetical protein
MHELKANRVHYCQWFQQLILNGVNIFDNVLFVDEALFLLSGYIKSQNSRILSSDNPHKVPLHLGEMGL